MKFAKEKIREAAMAFALAGDIVSIERYGSGHINDTFRMVTQGKQGEKVYILQHMNGDVFDDCDQLMSNVQRVTAHLADKIEKQGGDPERETLQVVPTKTGKAYHRDENGDGWRVYPFITNATSYDRPDTPEKFRQSGLAFGKFQYLLADFPAADLYETIINFHNTVDRFAKFKHAVEQDVMGRAKDVQEEIAFVLNREQDCAFFGDLLAKGEVPLRVTHNDTKLNNVLFSIDTGEAICVIDLDTVMPGFAAHDFGDAIRFGASTGAEDEVDLSKISCSMQMFEAYLQGFLKGCGGRLTRKEMETLPMGAKIMTFECGMRFLTDYLEGDVYFRTHREGHNLDRARTQFKLVADMETKWEEMSIIVEKYL